MKLYLIDSTYELFRAYFGAPKFQAAGGRPIGAVRGLVLSLLALIRTHNVTHIACAFDRVQTSFRNELFPGYKDGSKTPADLLAQFDLAEEALRALGISVWPMMEFEADDALATAAARWSANPALDQIIICSADKDLAQTVVGDRVVCLDRRRSAVLDEPSVLMKFGVLPRSIPDYLALVGDSSDQIPGIPGWGPKSTAAVLRRYGRMEDIPGDAADWDVRIGQAATLAASLASRRDEAALYKALTTLRLDVPLEHRLEDLRWRGATLEFAAFRDLLRLPESVGARLALGGELRVQ